MSKLNFGGVATYSKISDAKKKEELQLIYILASQLTYLFGMPTHFEFV